MKQDYNPVQAEDDGVPVLDTKIGGNDDGALDAKIVPPGTAVQPPPGAPEGGIWGLQYYYGPKTFMCWGMGLAALFGVNFGCFPGPLDTESVYWANGDYYSDTGKQLWRSACVFKPTTAKSAAEILTMRRY